MKLVLFLALLFPSLLPPLIPAERYGPCGEIVAGQMVGCANGRAYVRGEKGWQDAGPLHPEPILVPALPER